MHACSSNNKLYQQIQKTFRNWIRVWNGFKRTNYCSLNSLLSISLSLFLFLSFYAFFHFHFTAAAAGVAIYLAALSWQNTLHNWTICCLTIPYSLSLSLPLANLFNLSHNYVAFFRFLSSSALACSLYLSFYFSSLSPFLWLFSHWIFVKLVEVWNCMCFLLKWHLIHNLHTLKRNLFLSQESVCEKRMRLMRTMSEEWEYKLGARVERASCCV